MTTKLIEFRAPTVEELTEGVGKGADIVFIRRDRQGDDLRVFASYYEGSYQQWGQGVHVLGDNVEAVTAWANGLREVESLIDDGEDDADENETKGWDAGDRCDVPTHADRGEITTILPDTFADGFARVEVSLDCGGSVVVSVDDLDILYDEPEAARPY
ncbi:hypothetical protein KIKIMORA_04870 [Brevundimonas phage vB_BpoS-Kikimora]|uniref:Uncharacterized protein n=1 Tax=Brevundimonas phage vB_BpoS-Kikimora TaxID=2948601 RepID=A0A9E7MT55_9CAUD|nr:hypothetical protein KIKIMORA_04870 [Brevundimonas phage vB_BpoS-Kikimora]